MGYVTFMNILMLKYLAMKTTYMYRTLSGKRINNTV